MYQRKQERKRKGTRRRKRKYQSLWPDALVQVVPVSIES
jgi:hypothetical protein